MFFIWENEAFRVFQTSTITRNAGSPQERAFFSYPKRKKLNRNFDKDSIQNILFCIQENYVHIISSNSCVHSFWMITIRQDTSSRFLNFFYTPNGVFADYVAEIVEFNGEYSLIRDGKAVLNSDKLKTIQDGDIVSFPE